MRDTPFCFHTDDCAEGAGAALTQENEGSEQVIAFSSHRWSRTDSRRGATERMAVLWAVVHFRPFLSGRRLTLITDCSALLRLFRSRDLDPKIYRWTLCPTEFDMDMKWKAASSHQLPDALSPESVGDSFPDDCTSGNPLDDVGPRGPVLEGQLLNELHTFSEGATDPGGIREKTVVQGVDQTVSRRPTSRPMLSVIIDSIPRAGTSRTDLAAPYKEFSSDAQLATLPFHDRVAALGADRPVVVPTRSGCVLTRSVRLTPLSDPLVRPRVLTHTERAPQQPEPGPQASRATSTTTAIR